MKTLKIQALEKIMAIALVLVLTATSIISFTFFALPARIFAASMPINIYVEDYSDGTLNIRWDAVPQTDTARIFYHSPLSTEPDKLETLEILQAGNEAEITGLINDVIYDIDVRIYNSMGLEIARGLLYFLPSMTFRARILGQAYADIEGGGREIGIDPGINLEWAMPVAWNGAEFRYCHQALSHMEQQLRDVYSDGREIAKLDFRINISTDLSKLDGSSPQAAVIIEHDPAGDEYQAYVSGSELLKSNVRAIDADGFMDFDLLGRKDDESDLPLPQEYQLPHAGILPGTVYYMNIKPVFYDNDDSPVGVVVVGAPEQLNGSPILGPVPYVFTPVRFQITKDDMNNMYVKIFRINQGSLDLPRLYYEVQSIDDPTIPGDWVVKRRIDDTYFSGGVAITVISGVHPGNEFFYKIVVKSDSVGDRLESSRMPYTLVEDTSRPPVPVNLGITERLHSSGMVINPITGEEVFVRSTDVTLSWDKPANWETVKDDLYFHIILNTCQVDTDEGDEAALYTGDIYWGTYPVKYRLIKYISAKSPNIKETGNRLSYMIKGFELFRGEGEDGLPDELIDNPDNYPGFLLPNMVYFVRMYTTKAADAGSQDPSKMSDHSLVKSFTTLSGIEREVPLPSNITVNRNMLEEIQPGTKQNLIELQFDKVNIDWNLYIDNYNGDKKVYYDLFMSTRTDAGSFVRIGTTQYPDRDTVFTGADDPASSYIRAGISTITRDINEYIPYDGGGEHIDPYDIFGAGLRPNTTYYFVLRTRLAIEEDENYRISLPTPVLAATTLRLDIEEPDDTARLPLAPVDFGIAVDESGNPEISGSRVVFSWSLQEPGTSYEIICTSSRVSPGAMPSEYTSDPVYASFISHFGNKDSNGDSRTYVLNPGRDLRAGVFEYDSAAKTFKLAIGEWIFPNSLYYFSIRAQKDGKNSVWVSIPATTAIIEAPDFIEPLHDAEIGFFWNEYDSNIRPEDYRIYLMGPNDNDYRQVAKSDVLLTRDGTVFYARIKNLMVDSCYAVKVYSGINSSVLVYENASLYTRSGCYEIEVKWRGDEGYRYEIAIRAEDDDDYITVNDAGLEHFYDRYNRFLPYYIEETQQTAGTGKSIYYARIKSIPRVSSDGKVIQAGLEHNTKYYVRVRAFKEDPLDSTVVAYSKYSKSVFLRTAFSKEDYDREEEEKKKKDIFEVKIDKFENSLYWEVNTQNSSERVILLKGDRIANYIENSRGPFLLELGDMPYGVHTCILYMPENIAGVLKNENKEFRIDIGRTSFIFRPKSLDMLETARVKELRNAGGVKEVLIELRITVKDESIAGILADTRDTRDIYRDISRGKKTLSPVVELEIKVSGVTRTYSEIKNMIEKRLYDSETGIVTEKAKYAARYYKMPGQGSNEFENYTDGLIRQIEKELAVFIQNTLYWSGARDQDPVAGTLGSPLNIKMPVNYANNNNYNSYGLQGLITLYAKYAGSEGWSPISRELTRQAPLSYVEFSVTAPGKYVLLGDEQQYYDIPAYYPDSGYIRGFISKYDISSIFNLTGGALHLERTMSVREAVLICGLAVGGNWESYGVDLKETAKNLGLDKIINVSASARDITREEAAGLIMKIYSVLAGMEYEKLRPSSYFHISDEKDINGKYSKAVLILVESNIMKLDDNKCFKPGESVTRGEMLAAIGKIIGL